MASPHGGFPEPGVQGLDSVCRVHDFAQVGRELGKRDEVFPGVSLRLDHRRIFGFPVLGELLEQQLGCFEAWRGVHRFELFGDWLLCALE